MALIRYTDNNKDTITKAVATNIMSCFQITCTVVEINFR